MNSIAYNIKTLRRERGLTQEQFAQALHVTRQTVSAWERGLSQPDLETLEKIAQVLETDISRVLYGGPSAGRPRYQAVSFWPVLAVLPLWYVGTMMVGAVLQAIVGGGEGDALLLLSSQIFWGMVMVFCYCSLKDEIRNQRFYEQEDRQEGGQP